MPAINKLYQVLGNIVPILYPQPNNDQLQFVANVLSGKFPPFPNFTSISTQDDCHKFSLVFAHA